MNKIILTIFLASVTWSCATKKQTQSQTKVDSIVIEKTRVDTIYKEKVITRTEPIYTEIEIPCDSANLNQTFTSGKSTYTIKKDKGKVKLTLNKTVEETKCENEYKVLQRENNLLKSKLNTSNKEVVKTPFFSSIWKILFFIILLLWILGLTPRFLISKFI